MPCVIITLVKGRDPLDIALKLKNSEENKMKNMKKALAMLLALTMILALCACGSKTEAPAAT